LRVAGRAAGRLPSPPALLLAWFSRLKRDIPVMVHMNHSVEASAQPGHTSGQELEHSAA
jgi:hypothetical protein